MYSWEHSPRPWCNSYQVLARENEFLRLAYLGWGLALESTVTALSRSGFVSTQQVLRWQWVVVVSHRNNTSVNLLFKTFIVMGLLPAGLTRSTAFVTLSLLLQPQVQTARCHLVAFTPWCLQYLLIVLDHSKGGKWLRQDKISFTWADSKAKNGCFHLSAGLVLGGVQVLVCCPFSRDAGMLSSCGAGVEHAVSPGSSLTLFARWVPGSACD